MKQKNDMVEVVDSDTFVIDDLWLHRIKDRARAHPKQRYRTCIHKTDDADVHEMLIAHTDQTYVRPHKHRLHRESLQIVEGSATVVLFLEDGEIQDVWPVGDTGTGRPFFYSLGSEIFHMLIIESKDIVFKETTHGPFVPEDQIFADWAPSGTDTGAVGDYLHAVRSKINNFCS